MLQALFIKYNIVDGIGNLFNGVTNIEGKNICCNIVHDVLNIT